jgi:xanthine dehydrogenase accessory factor
MRNQGILQQAAELARRGETFALATVVWRQGPSSSQQGAQAIVTASGELHGWIGGACAEPVVIREARDVIASGNARLLLLGSPDQFGYPAQPDDPAGSVQGGRTELSGPSRPAPRSARQPVDQPVPHSAPPAGMTFVPIACQSEGALEVFIEPMLPVPHLVIVGGSPMAGTLAGMARSLGWQADLIAGHDFTAADASERSLVVVATQGHDDEGVLERALAARPAYLGLVASARRGATVLGYLADRGADARVLARVKVPAGLNLGRTTHEEIAVAVLAELVQLRAAGELTTGQNATGQNATGQNAAGQRPGGSGAATTATDPICGMTVEVGPASRASTHEGRTYYFCGAGCQHAFAARPAAHVTRETPC